MEAGEEKGGWESGFYFLIFTDIVKMGWATLETRASLSHLTPHKWGLFSTKEERVVPGTLSTGVAHCRGIYKRETSSTIFIGPTTGLWKENFINNERVRGRPGEKGEGVRGV